MNFVYDKVFLFIKLAFVSPTTIVIVKKIFFFVCDESYKNQFRQSNRQRLHKRMFGCLHRKKKIVIIYIDEYTFN